VIVVQPAAEIVRSIASLFRTAGYSVTGVVRDPTANSAYLFFVDDGQFKDADGIELPTAVHVSPTSGEVKFDGILASELERLLARTSFRAP
jgi:hypothetical protein